MKFCLRRSMVGCAIVAACISPQRTTAQITSQVIGGVTELTVSSFESAATNELGLHGLFSTSGEAHPLELFRVSAVRLLADGGVAIANSGTHEVIVLDVAGRLRNRFGGEGKGPGEFTGLTALDVGYSEELITYDPRQARLTFFSVSGDVMKTVRLSEQSSVVDLKPLTRTRDGRILAIHGQVRRFASGGERRDMIPLLMFGRDGGNAQTLAAFPGTEFIYIPVDQGVSRRAITFGRKAVASGRNGRVAIGSTDSLVISVYDAGRLTYRIRGDWTAAPVRPEHVARWKSDRLAGLDGASSEQRRASTEVPYRRTFPMFDDVLVDDRGRVWIADYPMPGEEQQVWLVVDVEKAESARIVLPTAATLMDVRGDRVAVLERNEWDEESVRVLRIN